MSPGTAIFDRHFSPVRPCQSKFRFIDVNSDLSGFESESRADKGMARAHGLGDRPVLLGARRRDALDSPQARAVEGRPHSRYCLLNSKHLQDVLDPRGEKAQLFTNASNRYVRALPGSITDLFSEADEAACHRGQQGIHLVGLKLCDPLVHPRSKRQLVQSPGPGHVHGLQGLDHCAIPPCGERLGTVHPVSLPRLIGRGDRSGAVVIHLRGRAIVQLHVQDSLRSRDRKGAPAEHHHIRLLGVFLRVRRNRFTWLTKRLADGSCWSF